jgi:hypothetical protein
LDAASLRPDICLAKYSGVAAARHFALGFTLLLPLCPPVPLSPLRLGAWMEPALGRAGGGRSDGSSAPPMVSHDGGGGAGGHAGRLQRHRLWRCHRTTIQEHVAAHKHIGGRVRVRPVRLYPVWHPWAVPPVSSRPTNSGCITPAA